MPAKETGKPKSEIDRLIGDLGVDDDEMGGGLGAQNEQAAGADAQAKEAEAELVRPDVVEQHNAPKAEEPDEFAGVSQQTRAEMELGRQNIRHR